jgi:hypothetical protein
MNTDIWAFMVHLGCNCWADHTVDRWGDSAGLQAESHSPEDYMRFDDEEWQFITSRVVALGGNMILLDLAEGLQYESHPELSVKGAWSKDRLEREKRRLAEMGIELIPKLNFSTGHDTWLKEYHRMVSTPDYYRVCSDLIAEVSELFGKPRFFHLGYDEETIHNQRASHFAVVRQGELWWHDFLWFNETVKKAGSRSWIWSDYGWRHRDEFLARMPRDVLQSNWYYYHIDGEQDKEHLERIAFFDELDKAGFDQIPCGSAYSWKPNFTELVRYCRKHLAGSPRLKGFMLAPWMRTWNRFHDRNSTALEAFEMGKKA